MIISDEIKTVIEGTSFVCLVTVSAAGMPHPIVTGKAEVAGDKVVFGIYKMDATQKILEAINGMWVVAATKDGGPKGYRLTGTAEVKDKQLIFTPAKAEALI